MERIELNLGRKLILAGPTPLVLGNVTVTGTGDLIAATVVNGGWPLVSRNGSFVCPVGETQGIEVAPANSDNLLVIPENMTFWEYNNVLKEFASGPEQFTPLANLFTKSTSGETTEGLTITIPGKDAGDARDNLSWILRGFLGNVIESYKQGDPHRTEACRVVTELIDSVQDQKLHIHLTSDCSGLLHDI